MALRRSYAPALPEQSGGWVSSMGRSADPRGVACGAIGRHHAALDTPAQPSPRDRQKATRLPHRPQKVSLGPGSNPQRGQGVEPTRPRPPVCAAGAIAVAADAVEVADADRSPSMASAARCSRRRSSGVSRRATSRSGSSPSSSMVPTLAWQTVATRATRASPMLTITHPAVVGQGSDGPSDTSSSPLTRRSERPLTGSPDERRRTAARRAFCLSG